MSEPEPSASALPSRPGTRPWMFWKRISLGRKRRARRHMKALVEHALHALDVALGLVGDTANDAGVPGLCSALAALREVVQKIQTMKTTIEGVDTLDAHVMSLEEIVEKFAERRGDQPLSEDTREQIDELSRAWSEIAQKARDVKSRGRIRRFFTSNADAKKLEALVEEISTSIQQKFLLQGILSIKEDAHLIRRDVMIVREGVGVVAQDVETVRKEVGIVRDGVKVISNGIEVVHEDTKVVREDVGAIREDAGFIRDGIGKVGQDVETLMNVPLISAYAKNAQYDAGGGVRRRCLEGTRVSVLDSLRSWIIAACTRKEAILRGGSVFWINGLAGTGKTTVAYSISEWCDVNMILAANFFCSHSDAECSNPNLIFTTISRQLCHFHVPFKEQIAAVLRDHPDIVHAGPTRQFEELIVRPLETVRDSFPMSVIVLDALDECLDKEATSIILTTIAKFISRIAGIVLFVVTSRPERRITTLFETAAEDTLKDVTTPLLLHKIDLESTLNDIRRFLEDGFARLSRAFIVDKDWPAVRDVNRLAEMSGGLFIWAATALLFIMDQAFCDPQGQLERLLDTNTTSRQGGSILDSLYNQITAAVFSKAAPTLRDRLRHILGVIALAQEPLSISTLARLAELPESAVRNTLTGLGSVLYIPDNSAEAIHVIHLTFPEFLLTPSPTKPDVFRIAAADHHLALFSRCMVIMRGLKRNIAGIASPSTFKSEIPDLVQTVQECISPSLGYACRFWIIHLSRCVGATLTDDIYDLFLEFLSSHYLHWLEACSLLGVLEEVVNTFYTVIQACQALGGRFAGLLPSLVDYWRFTLTYAVCVDTAPLHVYHSALALAPTKSAVRKAYVHELDGALIVHRGARSEWAPCLDAYKGHSGKWVYAVAFSPGGDRFVTGGWDQTLKLWGTATRTMTLSFSGHTDDINCVAFSPDGRHVSAGLEDSTVCVSQVSSGDCVQALKGHTGSVFSVVYSADGRRILSATREGEVKLWDSSDGRCLTTFEATGNITCQTGISPDGGVIARGAGASLCLYDVSASTSEALVFPDNVEATTFSPDGRCVAARSQYLIQVWHYADKTLVRSIDVGDILTSRLAFSHDGTRISCGSYDGRVYLWQLMSDGPPRVLHGHTNWIRDISWSPDGLQLVSVADDGFIRVWHATQFTACPTNEEPVAPSGPHAANKSPRFALVRHKGYTALLPLPPASVGVVDFAPPASMPEGAPTLTLFADMVDVWDTILREVEPEDLSTIIRTRAWAVISGQQDVDFVAGLALRRPVSLSPNGSLVAYRSPTSDEVVDICDLRVGKVVASLSGHTHDVLSIVFSPDGALVATGSKDHSVKVWSLTSGDIVCTHTGHADWVRAAGFSSDGRLIASGSYDHTVRVFEAATGRIQRVLGSHRAWVVKVAFAAGDNHVLSLDDSDWIYVWDVASGALVYDLSLANPITLSLDGTGIFVLGHDSEKHALPPCDSDSSTVPVYAISKGGWVYARNPETAERLCWLPPEWRILLAWDEERFCCLGREERVSAVFDVSRLPNYAQTQRPRRP